MNSLLALNPVTDILANYEIVSPSDIARIEEPGQGVRSCIRCETEVRVRRVYDIFLPKILQLTLELQLR